MNGMTGSTRLVISTPTFLSTVSRACLKQPQRHEGCYRCRRGYRRDERTCACRGAVEPSPSRDDPLPLLHETRVYAICCLESITATHSDCLICWIETAPPPCVKSPDAIHLDCNPTSMPVSSVETTTQACRSIRRQPRSDTRRALTEIRMTPPSSPSKTSPSPSARARGRRWRSTASPSPSTRARPSRWSANRARASRCRRCRSSSSCPTPPPSTPPAGCASRARTCCTLPSATSAGCAATTSPWCSRSR